MRNQSMLCVLCCFAIFWLFSNVTSAQSGLGLDKSFDLGGKRSQTPQFFIMESRFIKHSLDGTRTGTDIYQLGLKFEPARARVKGDRYTSTRFSMQVDGGMETHIPALQNWTYTFNDADAVEKGQVLGIDHSKFERITDNNGKQLTADKAYQVYNAFIDFHTFCDVFGQPTSEGKGIQNLRKIGDKIIHATAHSQPAVNLGTNVLPGSFFKNGEITLEFQGISRVNNRTCAVIVYDSGDSSFKVVMRPAPEFQVQTTGSSHYFGTIYKDISTHWVQKATMTEWVVSETILPVPPNRANSVIERLITIRNVSPRKSDVMRS